MKKSLIITKLIASFCFCELTAQNSSFDQDAVPLPGGTNNCAFGLGVLINTTPSSNNNSGFGWNALFSNSAGNCNAAMGSEALFNNVIGSYNVAIGDSTLYTNTRGSNNIAIGRYSLFLNNTGDNNIALGDSVLYNNLGDNNIAFGKAALYNNSNGSDNIACGNQALYNDVSGYSNIAIGTRALHSQNSGGHNLAIGSGALYSIQFGTANIAIGTGALGNSTLSFNNIAIGNYCYVNDYGHGNVALGNYAGAFGSTQYNTAIGHSALNANNSGHYNSTLGYLSNVSGVGIINNGTAIGQGAVVQGSDIVQLGDANVTQVECWSGNYFTTSDSRFKNNIKEDDVKGLEFIKRLRPVVYNMDTKKLTEFMVKNLPDSVKKLHTAKDFKKSSSIRQSGFIAQEVEQAAKMANYNFNGVHIPENEDGHYSVAYAQFVVPLVKSVQEQQQMIDELKLKIEEQKQINSELIQKLVTTSDNKQMDGINSNFFLGQNEPNPFTHETTIKYNLPVETNKAVMTIYDLTGKQVKLIDISAHGSSSLVISSDRLDPGIYIYSIIADGKIIDSKRMVIIEK